MNLLTDIVRNDREYDQLLATVKAEQTGRNTHQILISGLCDGAADAVYVSLIEDLKKAKSGPA